MEATPEDMAKGQTIVRVLAEVLHRLIGANTELLHDDPGKVTKFHALKAPGIGIQQYLERIHKYASCSNECFILALIYIDRLIQRNNFLLTDLNVHRVAITAVLLAAKFFDDAYYNNAYYAKVGGVLVSEMNSLEVEFLFRVNFSLHVSPEVFQKYHDELACHANGKGIDMPQVGSILLAMPLSAVSAPHVQPNERTVVPVPIAQQAPVATAMEQPRQLVSAVPPAVTGSFSSGGRDYHQQSLVQQITPSPPPHAGAAEAMPPYSNPELSIFANSSGGVPIFHHDHKATVGPMLQRHHSMPYSNQYHSVVVQSEATNPLIHPHAMNGYHVSAPPAVLANDGNCGYHGADMVISEDCRGRLRSYSVPATGPSMGVAIAHPNPVLAPTVAQHFVHATASPSGFRR